MRIWRISDHADLSGRGGLLADGRWHSKGTAVVYCADHPATAMLEILAHIDPGDVPTGYALLDIEVPDKAPVRRIEASELGRNWRNDLDATRAIGTDILQRAEHLLLIVPSVLVPHAWNSLLNPQHPAAADCSVAEVIAGVFDPRLIR